MRWHVRSNVQRIFFFSWWCDDFFGPHVGRIYVCEFRKSAVNKWKWLSFTFGRQAASGHIRASRNSKDIFNCHENEHLIVVAIRN